ncbi:MAG: MtnX-like HAD-IB family phosphatase [Candidatus Omnitrophica bacterium]|nr:MtnX-like HAD-IB family phosphatase [Candidatus Omnitrophota bacterium]MCM8791070.1 MtnX-like HAD-IB family phosphatase [Candidatus Omnitrophota bacterium]
MSKGAAKKYVVFFDFDNTITTFDVLDDMMERFSKDDRWIELERKWKKGEIGSRLCLDGQIRGIRITKKKLHTYLKTVKLDPAFKKLVNFLKTKRIKTVILSDDFGYILSRVLKNNGITGVRFYCNSLKLAKGKLIPSFPFLNSDCKKCAHCKKSNLMANIAKGAITVYVGDGLSDVCPSRSADIVFAKGSLERYCRKEDISYIPIKSLNDVYKFFKNL